MSLLKWYGSKRRITNWLEENIPYSKTTYDLFFGSGSFSFSRIESGMSNKIIASDLNLDIVNFWNSIKLLTHEQVRNIVKNQYHLRLQYLESPQETYQSIANTYNETGFESVEDKVGLFYFLNKTSFNGLWRKNLKGIYNTPWNKSKTYNALTADDLYKYREKMSFVSLEHSSYADMLYKHDTQGDVVYLDPPYTTDKPTSKINYGCPSFNHEEMVMNALRYPANYYISHSQQSTFHALITPHITHPTLSHHITYTSASSATSRTPSIEHIYRIIHLS